MSQFGARHYLAALKFRCRRRGGETRHRLRIVDQSLGEQQPLKMQHFSGVYEKFQLGAAGVCAAGSLSVT
jgi:hypothetical protein